MTKLSNSKLVSYINDKYVKGIDDEKTFTPPHKKLFNLEKIGDELQFFYKSLDYKKDSSSSIRIQFRDKGQKTSLSKLIKDRYKLDDDYYQLGVEKRDNALKSALYIINPSLENENDLVVEKYINCLRNKMGIELDTMKYFQIFEYRKSKYKKANMKDTLLNNRPFTEDVLHYLADYFKVNIIVVNSKIPTNFHIINTFANDRGNCYLIQFEEGLYQPIVRKGGDSIQYNKEIQY